MGTRSGILFLVLAAVFLIINTLGHGQISAAIQAEPGDVIISEVAWSGTAAQSYGEWIELFNRTDAAITLTGWLLYSDSGLTIELNGHIEANSFFLLERNDDQTVLNVAADQIFIGTLNNSGDALVLQNHSFQVIDTANDDGGPWPAGSGPPDFRSMERIQPDAADSEAGWSSNSRPGAGLDAGGNSIAGTPKEPNSSWSTAPELVDLNVHITGPGIAAAGTVWESVVSVSNQGSIPASTVVLTDTLPAGFEYVGDDSGFPTSQPASGEVVWQIGELPQGDSQQWQVVISTDSELRGTFVNRVQAISAESDFNPANNQAEVATTIIGSEEAFVLIEAVYYDGYELNDQDEAVRLVNLGNRAAEIAEWQLTDGTSTAVFPAGAAIPAGESIWVTRSAAAFRRQFGLAPHYEIDESDPSIPELEGTWPGFSNDGDEVILRDNAGHFVDVLVYGSGNTLQAGWNGEAVLPYTVRGTFASEGQITYRRREEISGEFAADTNQARDWAQWSGDVLQGRKVQYPGWDLNQFFFPAVSSDQSELTIAVAPDIGFEVLAGEIREADDLITIESLTFRSHALAAELAAAALRGVDVIVLLEGSPVGGMEEAQKLNCQLLEEAGGQCWFMISDDAANIQDRYRYLHAKFMIVDGHRAVISSENLNPNSFPNDDKADGTWGRRGVVLITDAAPIVNRLETIWAADFDPANHHDLFRWTAADPNYGAPVPGTTPITETGGSGYRVRYPQPARIDDVLEVKLYQSPENSLRESDGLLELIGRGGAGDNVLVQQLVEALHWGPGDSSRAEDPNPRIEALLAAARRGARVRVMLDSFFPAGRENEETCSALGEIARIEKLNLRCIAANPTGEGIHNKMILLNIDGQGYVHLGSINGTELSHKGNREVALQVASNEAYRYLAALFDYDWPQTSYLPIIYSRYQGPADHLLFSEVLYDPAGADDTEFVEIVNPTSVVQSLGGFSLGDAVNRTDYEDVRRFPDGVELFPGETLVVAAAAAAFEVEFGFKPDYEIINSDLAVPDLVDDPAWGDPAAILQLGNSGDEILLRDSRDQIVDAIAYGSGYVEGTVSCELVIQPGRSLERFPYWRDTDNCPADFRNWTFPSPGSLP